MRSGSNGFKENKNAAPYKFHGGQGKYFKNPG